MSRDFLVRQVLTGNREEHARLYLFCDIFKYIVVMSSKRKHIYSLQLYHHLFCIECKVLTYESALLKYSSLQWMQCVYLSINTVEAYLFALNSIYLLCINNVLTDVNLIELSTKVYSKWNRPTCEPCHWNSVQNWVNKRQKCKNILYDNYDFFCKSN
jgi:hypothetical protein